ncbi:MAG: rhodanese-like domain-containing protein [bacterium]
MKGNLQAHSNMDTATEAVVEIPAALQTEKTPCPAPGSYRELSPKEFNARKDLAVIVLKDAEVIDEFRGFSEVRHLSSSSGIDELLRGWPCERPIGLACPDGSCSSRLAIRLSRQGFTVYHLAGGIHEWHQCSMT